MIWQIAWDLWMHRRRIKDTADDASLLAQHAVLDADISTAFASFLQVPNPDQSVHRWFARSPEELQHETLDWKSRWLEMVSTILP